MCDKNWSLRTGDFWLQHASIAELHKWVFSDAGISDMLHSVITSQHNTWFWFHFKSLLEFSLYTNVLDMTMSPFKKVGILLCYSTCKCSVCLSCLSYKACMNSSSWSYILHTCYACWSWWGINIHVYWFWCYRSKIKAFYKHAFWTSI